MGQIVVKGLGVVNIAGNSPTPEEARAIEGALSTQPRPWERFPDIPRPPEAGGRDPRRRKMNVDALEPPDWQWSDIDWRMVGPAGGAMAGAQLGVPLGPGGMGAGAALGGAAGYLLGDVAEGVPAGRTPAETGLNAVLAGGQEAVGAATGLRVADAVQDVTRATKGLLDKGRMSVPAERATRGSLQGVGLSRGDVSEAGIMRGTQFVMGRMPLIGRIFTKAAERKAGDLGARQGQLLDELAPSTTAGEVGERLVKAGRDRYRWVVDFFGDGYDGLRRAAAERGATVPTDGVRTIAAEQLAKLQAKTLPGAPVPEPLAKVYEQLDQLATLPPSVTWEQLDGAIMNFNASIKGASREGFSISTAAQLNDAAELAVRNMSDPQLARRIENMDGMWQSWKELSKSPAGQKFGRVEKNFFKPGFKDAAGSNADEFFGVALRAGKQSPQAMRSLRSLVGNDAMNRMLRRHIEESFDAALGSAKKHNILDMKALRKSLGIGDEASEAALREGLKGTMVPMDKLKFFIDTLEDATALDVPDVSTYMARRLTLGGFQSAARAMAGPGSAALAAGAADQTSLTVALVTIAGTRAFAQAVANPSRLNMMNLALSRALKEGTVTEQTMSQLMLALTAPGQQKVTEALGGPKDVFDERPTGGR